MSRAQEVLCICLKTPENLNFGQRGHLFSGRQNKVFRVWQKKSTNVYNNGFNDNYKNNDGEFGDNEDKKHASVISFE